jgi:hypothetical protein
MYGALLDLEILRLSPHPLLLTDRQHRIQEYPRWADERLMGNAPQGATDAVTNDAEQVDITHHQIEKPPDRCDNPCQGMAYFTSMMQ